jgi:hypothetical protein
LAAVPHVVVRTDGESGALETDNLMKLSTVAGQLRIKERRSPPQDKPAGILQSLHGAEDYMKVTKQNE